MSPGSGYICVSGQPPIPAQAVWFHGMVARVGGQLELQAVEAARTRGHCGHCNATLIGAWAQDSRLGITTCRRCADELSGECLRFHQRLPAPGEFYCLGCHRILRVADAETGLCPRDPDGRRRWRCKPCRAAQVHEAEVRRRARRQYG